MSARVRSLEARQLTIATLGLVAFLGLTGFALDRAFTETAINSLNERLKSYAYAYYSGGEISRRLEFQPPNVPPDARFEQPDSGLYAALSGPSIQWVSPNTLGRELPLETHLPAGQTRMSKGPVELPVKSDGQPEFAYRFAMSVIWDDGTGKNKRDIPFVFNVFENTARLDQQIAIFRRALWGYLGAAGFLLLCAQVVALRWSLQPLRRVTRELQRVQRGMAEGMSGSHPRELAPLTESINAFIVSERENLDRYRNTLSDLAHSLKTPLAVLRSSLDNEHDEALRNEVRTQIQRMTEIVSYQLSRGANAGHQLFAAPLEIEARAEGIVTSLEKVYASKRVLCEFELDPKARFHGDLGDLMELLGNLLENAFKWAHARVLLSTRSDPGLSNRRPGLLLVVEDDGPGIPPEQVERLLQRGVRGDERVQGHGIGLSIVQNIVRAYHGELVVDASKDLGGARFSVRIPPGL